MVQTHRDPLKVIASVSALAAHLRRMASDETSIAEAAVEYADDIFLGLDRGDGRPRSTACSPPAQVVDVQFADFVADPIATIAEIYERLGRELTGAAVDADACVPRRAPRRRGRRRAPATGSPTPASTPAALRERAAAYQARHAVASEVLR